MNHFSAIKNKSRGVSNGHPGEFPIDTGGSVQKTPKEEPVNKKEPGNKKQTAAVYTDSRVREQHPTPKLPDLPADFSNLSDQNRQDLEEVKSWNTDSTTSQLIAWVKRCCIEDLRKFRKKGVDNGVTSLGGYIQSIIKSLPPMNDNTRECLKICEEYFEKWDGFKYNDLTFDFYYQMRGQEVKENFTNMHYQEFAKYLKRKYDSDTGGSQWD